MNKITKWVILFSLLFFISPVVLFTQFNNQVAATMDNSKSDVIIQGFYWNCTPGGLWWDSLFQLAPQLASAGYGAVWFPSPVKGMAGGFSMGYDPYDHYDFGEYNQNGSTETRFGSRQELLNTIDIYHSLGLEVWADAVMNHMNGGEQKVSYECKPYPSYPDSGYLIFNYPNGSGRFKKNASHFYPNLEHCNVDAPYHGDPVYQFGLWLDHDKQNVKDSLITWGQYLRNVMGFDGFRLDAAKHMDPIFVGPWLQSVNSEHYAVAEYYGSLEEIKTWLHYCQNVFGGDVSMFDFPLRFDLKEMCNNTSGTYDMTWLDGSGLINNGVSGYDVSTFLENHDFDRIGYDGSTDVGHAPVIYDKHLGYAYLLFSEGRPCVWFRDYFYYGLKGKIDTLIWLRHNFLYGSTTKRDGLNPWYVGSLDAQDVQARDIYVARRNGGDGKPQTFLVINDNPSQWRGVWVNSDHPNQVFRDYTGVAIDKQSESDGRVELWAPPRGYAVYIPDTTTHINHPPYIEKLSAQYAYTDVSFEYQISFGDPNHDSLSFQIVDHPTWLSISDSGKLSGIPSALDTGTHNVTILALDQSGDTASSSFTLTVVNHPIMDGIFEGTGIWGSALIVADTLMGWDSTRAKEIYVTQDQDYFYLSAKVKARQTQNWVFILNTKWGGGTTDSWGRSILYNHYNKPDHVLRGLFTNYAEFHTWTGSTWSNVGTGIGSNEFGENLISDYSLDGWVEGRILKSAIGNPTTFAVQFFITGSQNANATFDACPNDQNTNAWNGVTTRLNYYSYFGDKTLTNCNLQYPSSAMISVGDSVTVYARTFGLGITDSSGKGSGVQAWIGYNTTNNHPLTWINWQTASYNLDVSGNDEYKANLGAALPDGMYYLASRFQHGTSDYLYGGYNSNGGGIWDSINYYSGVLRVYGPPATPTLASPVNESMNEPITPILTWNLVSNAQTYHLQVSTENTFDNIIYDDSTITSISKQIGQLLNNATYHWRVCAKNITATSSFSESWSFTVNEITMAYRFDDSWNMISLPLNILDRRKSELFPNASSRAFAYIPDIGYSIKDTLEMGMGYWIKFPTADSVSLSGATVTLDTIDVMAGWNMIGSITSPMATNSIIQLPPNNVQSPYFTYRSGYLVSDTIKPSKSYWIKTDTIGKLILSSSGLAKDFMNMENENQLQSLNYLRIEDAAHHRQELYFGIIPQSKYDDDYFTLPPIPPNGLFDARFQSGRMVEVVEHGNVKELTILVSSAVFPVMITYESSSISSSVVLKYNNKQVTLTNGKVITIMEKIDNISLLISDIPITPEKFCLHQNYPNPFNPSTKIIYDLPDESRVNLKILNVLGQVVETLIDQTQDAGYMIVDWIPGNIASGLYFYRLDVASTLDPKIRFSQVKKMIYQK